MGPSIPDNVLYQVCWLDAFLPFNQGRELSGSNWRGRVRVRSADLIDIDGSHNQNGERLPRSFYPNKTYRELLSLGLQFERFSALLFSPPLQVLRNLFSCLTLKPEILCVLSLGNLKDLLPRDRICCSLRRLTSEPRSSDAILRRSHVLCRIPQP